MCHRTHTVNRWKKETSKEEEKIIKIGIERIEILPQGTKCNNKRKY